MKNLTATGHRALSDLAERRGGSSDGIQARMTQAENEAARRGVEMNGSSASVAWRR